MANITIKESRVLNLREFTGTDGRSWKGAELLWQGDEGAAFSPGQFLMAARKSKSFPWATPLTIQKKSGEGF